MSAKNGLAVSFRRRSRLIGCSAAVVFAFAALFAASAGAVTPPPTQSYLALGDSLAFGYSQQLFNENEKLGEPPAAFEHGYVNYYYQHLRPRTNHVALQNNGCPGETTDSMIGNGALAAAFGIPGESPCGYHKLGLPLHHEYGGTKSQLESAVETLAVDAGTGKPATTITLNIGANDELKAVHACEKEVKEEYETEGKSGKYGGENPEQSVGLCISAHAKGLFEHIIGNIDRILYAIRHGSAFGGVDYAGKIIVQGGYDPYGNVFGTGELLKGSTSLAQILNGAEGKNVTDSGEEAANEGHEPWGACFANPFPKFNPLKPKLESERLQKWTNMANFTEFEGKKNGPDIHPTLAGYKVLNTVMVQTCG